jgi:hypothetical protein
MSDVTKRFINTTPHPINLEVNDEVVVIPPSGVLLNATAIEVPSRLHASGAQLVGVRFESSFESEQVLDKLESENPNAVIIGSIIAAQAFPGRVFATIPCLGYERVPPDQKRMRSDKFTTF